MTRSEHILDIANAGLDGMSAAMTPETTSTELLAAHLTILARFVQVLMGQGVEERSLRQCVERVFPPPVSQVSDKVH